MNQYEIMQNNVYVCKYIYIVYGLNVPENWASSNITSMGS